MFLCFKVSKNDQGQSKGFGFVCFETEQQAENALRLKTNKKSLKTKHFYKTRFFKNKQTFLNKGLTIMLNSDKETCEC